MYIVWGTGLFGKVDTIPGLGHVATQFGHLYWIPLIPMESMFVIHDSSRERRGVKIGMSGKSILIAWLRFTLGVTCFASAVWVGVNIMDARPDWFKGIMLPIGTLVGFVATYFIFGRASYSRACTLAEEVGLNELGLLRIEAAYRRITPEEAEEQAKLLVLKAAAEAARAQASAEAAG